MTGVESFLVVLGSIFLMLLLLLIPWAVMYGYREWMARREVKSQFSQPSHVSVRNDIDSYDEYAQRPLWDHTRFEVTVVTHATKPSLNIRDRFADEPGWNVAEKIPLGMIGEARGVAKDIIDKYLIRKARENA